MKIRKRTEPDLYVVNKPFTESEKKEFSLIIENYKKSNKIKYPKIKPAAAIKKVKKYEVVEANMAFAREPEPDLYIEHRPLTDKDRKEIIEYIEKDKKKRTLAAKRKLARKKANAKA